MMGEIDIKAKCGLCGARPHERIGLPGEHGRTWRFNMLGYQHATVSFQDEVVVTKDGKPTGKPYDTDAEDLMDEVHTEYLLCVECMKKTIEPYFKSLGLEPIVTLRRYDPDA